MSLQVNPLLLRSDWMHSGDIRPYVFVRPENRIESPGTKHKLDWFAFDPILKNPLDLGELPFAEAIYQIEWKAFGNQDLAIPRWVFYDCAAMPGFVAGFAGKTKSLPKKILNLLSYSEENEWCPISLFIITPTMHKGEWVAFDLCSVNSLLPQDEQYYGLGFLSKAFGLWYANVHQCSGMTQWGSASLKLHSHFGHLEVIGSYAPLHTHARTMTYRCEVNTDSWEKFFTKKPDLGFLEKYGPTDILIDPSDEQSMIGLQQRIQNKEGPFYLNAGEIAKSGLKEKLTIYKLKQG
jgi:hypothetical protein